MDCRTKGGEDDGAVAKAVEAEPTPSIIPGSTIPPALFRSPICSEAAKQARRRLFSSPLWVSSNMAEAATPEAAFNSTARPEEQFLSTSRKGQVKHHHRRIQRRKVKHKWSRLPLAQFQTNCCRLGTLSSTR